MGILMVSFVQWGHRNFLLYCQQRIFYDVIVYPVQGGGSPRRLFLVDWDLVVSATVAKVICPFFLIPTCPSRMWQTKQYLVKKQTKPRPNRWPSTLYIHQILLRPSFEYFKHWFREAIRLSRGASYFERWLFWKQGYFYRQLSSWTLCVF